MWLYGKTLTVEFANTPLTQFKVAFQPDQKRLRTVKLLHRFETHYRSPQLSLWSEEDVTWLLAWKAQDNAAAQDRATNSCLGNAADPFFGP